jgi:hypothetical protein
LLALLISEPLGGGRGAVLLALPPLLLLLLSSWKLLLPAWTLLQCVLRTLPNLRTLVAGPTKA